MAPRIGILRCLLYYPFYPFWRRFFSALGMTVVPSPPMTGEVFDHGQRRFIGDICLPIESAFYHADVIKGEVDILFVPRVNRIHQDVYVCPACAGLTHVVRYTVPDLPDLLSINLSPFLPPERSDFSELRRRGYGRRQVQAAYDSACEYYNQFVAAARHEPDLDAAIAGAVAGRAPASPADRAARYHLLLLGMPYVLGDGFINHGVPQMLSRAGCRLTTPFMTVPDLANCEMTVSGYCLYWTFACMSLAAMKKHLSERAVDGVVYCSSFACGVDSLMAPLVQSSCQRCYEMPFTHLILDEHAERGHLETRIEAFLDCVGAWRRNRKDGR